MTAFKAPKTALGSIEAEVAATLIAAAADIALILDERGVIQDVSIAEPDLVEDLAGHANWPGKHWSDTVTEESRPKVTALLADASSRREPRWRHLNHIANSGDDVPILYAAVQASPPETIAPAADDSDGINTDGNNPHGASPSGNRPSGSNPHGNGPNRDRTVGIRTEMVGSGRIVAFGRDLRAVSSLQRRLVDAQQSLERDYARVRHAETRYRMLFQMAADAVLIVDGTSLRVLDSNPTARRLVADAPGTNRSWHLSAAFTPETARSVELLLAGVRASGRADDVHARLITGDQEVVVSASLFRDEAGISCLVRIATPPTSSTGAAIPKLKAKLLKLMEIAPDGFVVTGTDGRVITANATFLELAQLPTEEQARGEPLERWVGRSSVELDILTANLRQHGSVRMFATTMRGELGEPAEVEISAVTVMNGGQPCFGFAIRDVGRRQRREQRIERALPRSLEHLTELIGRVALKDLVREATDVIERLCIESALNLTGDNRASAAEMLGLSRQSLYVKLRRYGMGDPEIQGAD